MIPCKKTSIILEHKMSLGEHEDKNNGQFELKRVPLVTVIYRSKVGKETFK